MSGRKGPSYWAPIPVWVMYRVCREENMGLLPTTPLEAVNAGIQRSHKETDNRLLLIALAFDLLNI